MHGHTIVKVGKLLQVCMKPHLSRQICVITTADYGKNWRMKLLTYLNIYLFFSFWLVYDLFKPFHAMHDISHFQRVTLLVYMYFCCVISDFCNLWDWYQPFRRGGSAITINLPWRWQRPVSRKCFSLTVRTMQAEDTLTLYDSRFCFRHYTELFCVSSCCDGNVYCTQR
jgi:hypothetical protein